MIRAWNRVRSPPEGYREPAALHPFSTWLPRWYFGGDDDFGLDYTLTCEQGAVEYTYGSAPSTPAWLKKLGRVRGAKHDSALVVLAGSDYKERLAYERWRSLRRRRKRRRG